MPEIKSELLELIYISTYDELDQRLKYILKQIEVMQAEKQLAEASKPASSPNFKLEQIQSTSAIIAEQKTIAENQKAIAEAQRDAFLAQFSKGETKPLEGDIKTSEKFGYVAQIASYKLLERVSKEIARDITAQETREGKPLKIKIPLKKGDKILIVNDLDVASNDLPLIQVESGISFFGQEMRAQIKINEEFISSSQPKMKVIPAIALAPMVISGILSSVADIAGYFQTDYEIKSPEFKLDNQALVSNVAGAITGFEVYIYNFNLIKESAILNHFRWSLHVRARLDRTVERIKTEIIKPINEKKSITEKSIEELEKKKNAETDNAKKQKIIKLIEEKKQILITQNSVLDQANTNVAISENLSKTVLTYLDSISKTSDANGLPLLFKAALRKHIRTDGITHLLNLKIVSSGGEAITMKRRILIWMANVSFIGGCSASYILATKEGKVMAADTYTGLARINFQLDGGGKPSLQEITLNQISNI